MVNVARIGLDVSVFFPSTSLLLQMAGWLRESYPFYYRLIAARQPMFIKDALSSSASVIIDATERPDDATAVLELSVGQIGPHKTIVYTERMHEGLEVFARTRGVQLLLGPMGEGEWRGFFESLDRAKVTYGRRRGA